MRMASSDYAINMLAFFMYIASQQFLLLPSIARVWGGQEFAYVVLFVSIYAITTNVLGEELGNALLVRRSDYAASGWPLLGDYIRLLIASLCFVALGIASWGLLSSSPLRVVGLILAVTCNGVVRCFVLAVLRARGEFRPILLMNAAYALGAAVGLLSMVAAGSPYVAFLAAEVLALLVGIIALRVSTASKQMDRSPGFGRSASLYLQFGGVALITNAVVYLDRIMVLPLLGEIAMGVYYAASSVAKSVSLTANPISGVVLARVGLMERSARTDVVRGLLARLPLLLLTALALAYSASWLGVEILYPQFAKEAQAVFLPAAIAASLGVGSSLARPILMRFFTAKWLLGANVVYAVGLIPLVVVGVQWGVVGFAWAIALSRGIQLAGYVWAVTHARQ